MRIPRWHIVRGDRHLPGARWFYSITYESVPDKTGISLRVADASSHVWIKPCEAMCAPEILGDVE